MVFPSPKLTLIVDLLISSLIPITFKTGDSPTVPDEHADPFETSIPFRSSLVKIISFLNPGIAKLQIPGAYNFSFP